MKQFVSVTFISASLITSYALGMEEPKKPDWGHNAYLLQTYKEIEFINTPAPWKNLPKEELRQKAGAILEGITYEGDKNNESSVKVDLQSVTNSHKSSMLKTIGIPVATTFIGLGVGYFLATKVKTPE